MVTATGRGGSDRRTKRVDAGRLGRTALLTFMGCVAADALYHNAVGAHFGNDFQGILEAARAVRRGLDPYVGGSSRALALKNNPYVLPPLAAELALPLAALSFPAAIAIFDAICAVSMVA